MAGVVGAGFTRAGLPYWLSGPWAPAASGAASSGRARAARRRVVIGRAGEGDPLKNAPPGPVVDAASTSEGVTPSPGSSYRLLTMPGRGAGTLGRGPTVTHRARCL